MLGLNSVYIGIIMFSFYRVNSSHNQGVTDKTVKDVSEAGEYLDKDSIACKLLTIILLRWFVDLDIFLQMLPTNITSTL